MADSTIQAYEQRIRQVQASCERFSDRHARTKDASRRAYYSRQIERCRNEIAHLQRQINSLRENAA